MKKAERISTLTWKKKVILNLALTLNLTQTVALAKLICTPECKYALLLKKLASNNPKRLYFITLDRDNLVGGANETRFERGDWL